MLLVGYIFAADFFAGVISTSMSDGTAKSPVILQVVSIMRFLQAITHHDTHAYDLLAGATVGIFCFPANVCSKLQSLTLWNKVKKLL